MYLCIEEKKNDKYSEREKDGEEMRAEIEVESDVVGWEKKQNKVRFIYISKGEEIVTMWREMKTKRKWNDKWGRLEMALWDERKRKEISKKTDLYKAD